MGQQPIAINELSAHRSREPFYLHFEEPSKALPQLIKVNMLIIVIPDHLHVHV